MPEDFFKHPILNSPYEFPGRHWELDSSGQPTQRIIEARRIADFITPIPKAGKKRNPPPKPTGSPESTTGANSVAGPSPSSPMSGRSRMISSPRSPGGSRKWSPLTP